MSEAGDALREMAANRGFRLVKSRRRKPGGDFGRYGLKNAKTGAEVLGFGGKGLTASAEEITEFLRGGAAKGWKGSLGVVGKPTAKAEPKTAKVKKAKAPKKAKPEPKKAKAEPKKAEPKPPREPAVREAKPKDSDEVAALITALGYEVSAADIRKRIGRMRKAGEPALVADNGRILGCVTWHVTPVLHRPRPVGRVTMIVVAEEARSKGVGTLLVEAVTARLKDEGCGMVEVTSNTKRLRAHNFYNSLGFERTSYRFAKPLDEA